jgi:hypothetical protein
MNLEHHGHMTDDQLVTAVESLLFRNQCRLNVDQFCNQSGVGDFDTVEVDLVERNDVVARFTARVEFDEIEPSGCGNIPPHKHRKSCVFPVAIQQGGEIVIGTPHQEWDGREYWGD